MPGIPGLLLERHSVYLRHEHPLASIQSLTINLKHLGESNECASHYLTSSTPFQDLTCLVTIRGVKTGKSSGWLER